MEKIVEEIEKIEGFKVTKLSKMPNEIKQIGTTIGKAITTLWTTDILNFDLFLYDGESWYQVE